jgi:hypothetical protein
MTDVDWETWFREIWATREEALYPQFFGAMEKGMYPLTAKTFEHYHSGGVPDPRFLFHGVLWSAPNEKHDSWLFVSSGMSNAWEATPETANPNEYSGLGFEFVMEAPPTAERPAWPVTILHWLMAIQLLVATEKIKGGLVEYADRVPVGGAVDGKESLLRSVLIARPQAPCAYPAQFGLITGKVDLMLCVGITEKEREFAKAQGTSGLLELLFHRNVFPVTDASRLGLV